MRKILGILLGIVAAIVIFIAIDRINDIFYPLPVDIEFADEVAAAAAMIDRPPLAKLLLVAPWLLGALGGTWIALRISDWRPAGWIIVALVLVTAIVDIVDMPYPLWMELCAILLPILGGWLAARLHRKPYPGEPLLG